MLGKRLKKFRGKRTQDEVAKKIGISRARYSHYENGRSEPDTDTLQKLADYFDVTIDYLLGRADSKIEFNENEIDFLRDLDNLPDEDLFKKYNIVDEEELTPEEIKELITFIRARRHLVNLKKKQ